MKKRPGNLPTDPESRVRILVDSSAEKSRLTRANHSLDRNKAASLCRVAFDRLLIFFSTTTLHFDSPYATSPTNPDQTSYESTDPRKLHWPRPIDRPTNRPTDRPSIVNPVLNGRSKSGRISGSSPVPAGVPGWKLPVPQHQLNPPLPEQSSPAEPLPPPQLQLQQSLASSLVHIPQQHATSTPPASLGAPALRHPHHGDDHELLPAEISHTSLDEHRQFGPRSLEDSTRGDDRFEDSYGLGREGLFGLACLEGPHCHAERPRKNTTEDLQLVLVAQVAVRRRKGRRGVALPQRPTAEAVARVRVGCRGRVPGLERLGLPVLLLACEVGWYRSYRYVGQQTTRAVDARQLDG